ncbi:hypothetical protein MRB53_027017 [Persea americana]|uniref:Uncharacterized protein n=1 Tax=Persea americana TaxID=3435 RepID=A0ACC2LKZ4_PERAE|nr:hypothetical protein MRB53_027017 [Persea americana]
MIGVGRQSAIWTQMTEGKRVGPTLANLTRVGPRQEARGFQPANLQRQMVKGRKACFLNAAKRTYHCQVCKVKTKALSPVSRISEENGTLLYKNFT